MKKIKVLLSALAMVAAMAFVSCGGAADGTSGPGAVESKDVVLTLQENVGSYDGDKKITADELKNLIEKASGDVTITFKCELAIDEDNTYDWVGQLAGWDSSWNNSTDDFNSYTFKLNGTAEKIGDEFEISFNVASILSDLPNTTYFCVNIWDEKFKVNKIIVSYTKK